MPRVNVRVRGVRRTIREIKRDLHRGMEKAGNELADDAKDTARRVIQEKRAIFNAEVYSGFKVAETRNNQGHVRLKLYNDVDHAGALEDGVSATEYADGGPPVQALLPWVSRKLNGNISTMNDRDGGDSGSSNASNTDPDPIDYNFTKQGVSEDDEVIVEDGGVFRDITITSKSDDSFEGEGVLGSTYQFDYDAIYSRRSNHPVSDRLNEFERGDTVQFYDGDELREGVLTGEKTITGDFLAFQLRDTDTDDIIGYVPEVEYVHWNSPPELDDSFVTDKMKSVTVNNNSDAEDEIIHYQQNVVLYNQLSGETKSGTVIVPPNKKKDELTIEFDDGGTIRYHSQDDWQLEYGDDVNELSKSELDSRLLSHFDDNIDKSVTEKDDDGNTVDKSLDSTDESWLKQNYEKLILEYYTDKEHLAKVGFQWGETKSAKGRAHAGGRDFGWTLQMYPATSKTGRSDEDWQTTLGHEFGHGYTQPTPADYSFYSNDPIEYKFANPWPDRNDSQYSHMYDEGLPNWEPSAKDPVHGYIESYMFANTDKDYVSYKNGDIYIDNRDEIDPYGFHDWEDHVAELAVADATGTSRAMMNADVSITELDSKQVFKRDDFQVESGDFVAFEIDGETEVFRHTNRDGGTTLFSPSSNGNPDEAEAIGFEKVGGDISDDISLYVDDSGNLYEAESNAWGESELVEASPTFLGKASLSNYDESQNEFPDLVSSENPKRIQEAANMAFWYQVKHIEADTSMNKQDSHEIVMRGGYSATYSEEVMSTFTEPLAVPNPTNSQLDDLETLMERYPFFIEAFLEDRQPLSEDARKLLEDEGFL